MPAAAVKQNPQALPEFIGRKVCVAGLASRGLNLEGSTFELPAKLPDLRALGADGTLGGGVKSVDIKRNTKSEGIQLGRP
ncbi:MAG: hypothetical protein A3J30_03985 [Candidatus Wildermuthbacteria bacterium RIFCSPLOWO2_02_FULL_47_9c]|uniref:Uncharacterized protein n=1 Tax=Candidatus Wildermuthbacteria bacterium RIFCSPLOWO2_02_FULL_47_9c TaxID=1802466 RepID=A0A1G2RTA1_9BACT|nr:MAG: hypothetical protein A3J30_03985 [Candidatus Wildermuthbacteria bacterium RIFCSPLOWO2_02_FULL_47_9c]